MSFAIKKQGEVCIVDVEGQLIVGNRQELKQKVLDEIERRPGVAPAVRRERTVAMIMLITATVAERARCLDQESVPELSHDEFVANLVAMCAALMEA